MNTKKLFEVLSVFHPLYPACKDVLKRELRHVIFPKGHNLVQAHTAAHHAFFLEKGFVVGFRYERNRRIVTGFWQQGEIILSPKSFFEQSAADDIIQLTTQGELLSLSHASFLKLVEEFPVAGRLARDITADCYAKSAEAIVDLHTLDAWERYTKLVVRYPGIELNVSQELISSYLNITPQSLSRLKGEHH